MRFGNKQKNSNSSEKSEKNDIKQNAYKSKKKSASSYGNSKKLEGEPHSKAHLERTGEGDSFKPRSKAAYSGRDGEGDSFKPRSRAPYSRRDGEGDSSKPRSRALYSRRDGEGDSSKPRSRALYSRRDGERDSSKPRSRAPYSRRDGEGDSSKPRSRAPYSRRDGEGSSSKPRSRAPYSRRDDEGDSSKPRSRAPYSRRDDEGDSSKPRSRAPYSRRDGEGDSSKPRSRAPYSRRDGEGDSSKLRSRAPYSRRDGERDNFKPRSKEEYAKKKDYKDNFRTQNSHENLRNAKGSYDNSFMVEEKDERESERIAKRLARVGIASRREAEMMIFNGRIAVNGRIIHSPALDVKKTDKITVDGKILPEAERTRLWLYHKPKGLVTTTHDPEGRPTVFSHLPKELPRVLSIGRLDINTEGLLLLTNDGGLARILELPSTGWTRCYRVRAFGKTTQEQLDNLKKGIAIEGVFYGSIEAQIEREQGSNVWLTVSLREGKNREVKTVLKALGLEVNRLIRISYGPFQLLDLPEGDVREIKGRILRDQLGERLIAQAEADFDGPILKPFRKKLQNAFDEEGEDLKKEGPRLRSSNVWIAPGARPQGKKKKEKLEKGFLDTKKHFPKKKESDFKKKTF